MRSGKDAPHPSEAGTQWGAGDTSDGQNDPMPDYSKYIATLQAEREWRRLNRELWAVEVEGWALAEAAAGRKFSVAEAIQRIRWRDHVDDDGNPAKPNDHYGPVWSRLLTRLHPELEQYVVQRHTPWDDEPLKGMIA